MSSLIYEITDEAACVAVDTMCVNEYGEFRNYVSKAFAIPHLQIIIAGTGLLDVIERFSVAINSIPVSSHDELVDKAGELLTTIWEDWEVPCPQGGTTGGKSGRDIAGPTTTVFQFGFSQKIGAFEAVQYISGDSFKPQRMPPTDSLTFKPPAPLLGDKLQGVSELARIMLSQRAHESSKPVASRLHIGGDILLFTLSSNGISIQNVFSLESVYDAQDH